MSRESGGGGDFRSSDLHRALEAQNRSNPNMTPRSQRSLDAQQAAEAILGSSSASSLNSLPSQDQTYVGVPPYYSQSYSSNGYIEPTPHSNILQYQHYHNQVPFHPQLNYSHLQHRTFYQGSHQIPVVLTDDLVSGTQPNGRMSPVRRFFLLLCTFDLLFLSLLWIIAILVTGSDLSTEVRNQVLSYSIHTSMFDCICMAAIRFLLCMVFYGLLDVSHWWVIATTTTGTVAFLIAKVLQYKWHDNPITYDVMLVLLSFILAWGEAWFFDFRMVPLETKAKEIWNNHGGIHEDERAPLIPPAGQGGGMLHDYIYGSTLNEDQSTVRIFYSPKESPDNSDDDDVEPEFSVTNGVRIPRRFKRSRSKPISDQERELKKLAEDMLFKAKNNMDDESGWKVERQCQATGDIVQVKTINRKKVFRLTSTVDVAPSVLLADLYYEIEKMPRWNPTVVDCKILQHIDEFTDVTYQVAAEAGGGLVSTRDFVNLRHWAMVDGVYLAAAVSIQHSAMPDQPKKVRGENGPTCYALSALKGDPERCHFRWILDTDLKGWIPQSVIDKALSGVQLEYIQNVRIRASILKRGEDQASSVGSCVDAVTI